MTPIASSERNWAHTLVRARGDEVEIVWANSGDQELSRVVHEPKARRCALLEKNKCSARRETLPELLYEGVPGLLAPHLHLHVGGDDEVELLAAVVKAALPVHVGQR
eukprot:CAMPEP_0206490526 /NCGR_PEP_ID=MMETSP0324_2-20121206/44170_1 /ASSEMBLY_ACC=CAM_ASM_000836 /TAXON_ID=2866 /ORGANISM="Crypthecodinium cohnii, Strain Seligo" /LENGTH=106 /DNA_ID=CAMNT_0053970977 /DNA_START=689 /DNA_END=1005 /DNA_ORIENTATION=+